MNSLLIEFDLAEGKENSKLTEYTKTVSRNGDQRDRQRDQRENKIETSLMELKPGRPKERNRIKREINYL